jgi:hypothetical protein
MDFPTHAAAAPVKSEPKAVTRPATQTADHETDEPAHNFAMMGLAWLITMLGILTSFVVLQFLFR